jgi:hypothetical protein
LRPKAWWFIVSFCTGFLLAMAAEELVVHSQDDELRIVAPRLHFLTGASLDRLKNGAAVPYDFQLSLSLDSRTNLFDRAVERIAVSYDLWEEKYSATRLSASSTLRGAVSRRSHEHRSASHLTALGVENWCIDSLAVSTSDIGPSQSLWVRLEVRSVDPKDTPPLFGDSGVSLNRLIDLFSHPPRTGQQRWTLEAGPLRLSDIRKPATRGS